MCYYVAPMPRSGTTKCFCGIVYGDLHHGICSDSTCSGAISGQKRGQADYAINARRRTRFLTIQNHMEGKKQMHNLVTRRSTLFVTASAILMIIMVAAMAVPVSAG